MSKTVRLLCVLCGVALLLCTVPLTAFADTKAVAFDREYLYSWSSKNYKTAHTVSVTLPANGVLTVDAVWPTDSQGDRGDVLYTLYKADSDQPLWCSESYYCDKSASSYSLNVGLAAGTYRLETLPDFRVKTGYVDYRYTLRFAASPTELEPNGTAAAATAMTLGTTYVASMNERDHDYDYFTYTAAEGDVRQLYFSAWDALKNSNRDRYLYHIDSNGKRRILSDADLITDVNGDTCFSLPATVGTNTVYLSHYPDAPLNYTIRVTPPVPLNILEQPSDRTVYDGESLSTSVKASGKGLTYQWWLCDKGSTKFSRSSIKTDTYTVTMNNTRDGRRIYCVITDAYGVKTVTETVTLQMAKKFMIAAHPRNTTVPRGSYFTVSTKALGSGLSYQWYIKHPNDTAFKKSSVTSRHYTVRMTDSVDGRMLYCVVTDSLGNTLTTKTATVTMRSPRILVQPTDAVAPTGQYVSTTVEVTGKGLKYQWYIKDTDDKTFVKSSVTSKNYSYLMTLAKSGRQAYCVITDAYGDTVTSDTVTLRLPPLVIVTQPQDASAPIGSMVSTVVKATGDGLSYQWYVKDAGANSFVKSSVKSRNYSYTMTEAKSGRQVYCIITDTYGQTVKTDTVTLKKA